MRLAPEEELFDPAGAPLAPAQASAEGFAPREAEPEWDDLLTQLRAAKTKAKRPLITEEGTEE